MRGIYVITVSGLITHPDSKQPPGKAAFCFCQVLCGPNHLRLM
jgi:hypothetical protein